MTEETYDAKKLAVEMGFSEEEATQMAGVNVGEAKLRRLGESRRLARAKGLRPEEEGKTTASGVEVSQVILDELPSPKEHQHYYRTDGTCACGEVKGARAKVAKAKKKAEAEAKKRVADEAEAAARPAFEGENSPPE